MGTTSPSVVAVTRPRSCNYCHQTGHEMKYCFQLHGYPKSGDARGHSSYRGGRGGRNNCGGSRCRSNYDRASHVHVSDQDFVTAVPLVSGWNQEQVNALLTLLNAPKQAASTECLKGKASLDNVIIDTGASHHMTGDMSLITQTRDIFPYDVKFLDGSAAKETKIGVL